MGYRVVGAGLLIALLPGTGLSADILSEHCYIVEQGGHEHRVHSWNRLAVREALPHDSGDLVSRSALGLDSPSGVSALLYESIVIPIKDVAAILPELGLYLLRDGHLIEANPLWNCGFSREHRFLDLQRQRHRSTPGDPESPQREDIPLTLEVFVEFATMDTVAGYPVEGTQMIPIHHARIVAFDSDAVDPASELWKERTSQNASTLFSPYRSRLKRSADLRDRPEGDANARIDEDGTVEVLEVRGEWVRVKLKDGSGRRLWRRSGVE